MIVIQASRSELFWRPLPEIHALAHETIISRQCSFNLDKQVTIVPGHRRIVELSEGYQPTIQVRELRRTGAKSFLQFSAESSHWR
jgi:hypothetical protein